MAYSLAAQRTNVVQMPGTSGTTACKENGGRRQVQLVPFGDSALSFLNVVVADTKRPMDLVKCEGNRRYSVKINDQGMVTIEYEPDNVFTISVFNNSRWVTTLHIDAKQINIGNVAEAMASHVNTLRVTQNEARNVYTTFKIENRGTAQFKRLDVKGHNTTWFSIFSHNANLLMVRPNGNWVSEKMLYLTDQITTQAINNYRRSNGQEVLAANDTVVMQRRDLQQEKERFGKEANEMAERKRQWQEEKARFEQEANVFVERKREVQDEMAKFEQETTALAERKRQWQEKKARFEQEANVFIERKREVQEEMAKLEQETAALAERKRNLQQEKEEFEQAVMEVDPLYYDLPPLVQTFPWSSRKFTTPTLNNRFATGLRVIIEDGKMIVVKTQTHHDAKELD